MKYEVHNLFNLKETIAAGIFEDIQEIWDVLPKIHDYILDLGAQLCEESFVEIADNIWVEKSAYISDNASIQGPAIIDARAEIRPGAFLRGNTIIGEGCVVGNSTEIKNSILFNRVQVPHYNYVGDSVLGYASHLGAGAITSNVKSDKSKVGHTGLKKCGSFIGDYVEVGCQTVLNPGTIIGRNSIIYPLSSVRGYVPENKIYKQSENIVERR